MDIGTVLMHYKQLQKPGQICHGGPLFSSHPVVQVVPPLYTLSFYLIFAVLLLTRKKTPLSSCLNFKISTTKPLMSH